MPDVTIVMSHAGRSVEIGADTVAQARDRIATAWPRLFPDGPQREVAALEVVATLLVEAVA